MGSNVIYLAERVPSYRRRLPDICAPVSALPSPAPTGAWAAMARERAVRRQASLHEEAALPAASGGATVSSFFMLPCCSSKV
ncbi:MAG: hypothetical protein Q4F13_10465, partial [Pseudomonadota bacterium]|nr:hypothetical protein [Pseudomonadota bacterium]